MLRKQGPALRSVMTVTDRIVMTHGETCTPDTARIVRLPHGLLCRICFASVQTSSAPALEGSSTSETGLTGPPIAGNAGYRNPAGGHDE